MMSEAHIAAGVTAALLLAQAGSPESIVAAVAGGAVGGVIADCDAKSSRARRNALMGRLAVAGIAVAALGATATLEPGCGARSSRSWARGRWRESPCWRR